MGWHGLRRLATVTGCGLVILGCSDARVLDANKELVRNYMEQILNGGDLAAAPRFFPDSGFVFNGRLLTFDDLSGIRAGLTQRFPDFRLTVEDQIAEGDRVVTRVTFRGTHRGEFMGIVPTGRVVEYGGVAIDRIQDGKVVEGWHQADELGMLAQLGFLSER